MKVSDMFPNKWAKPEIDLKHGVFITIKSPAVARDGKDFNGEPTTLYDITIAYDNPAGEPEEKLFQLNATNAKAIAEVHGQDDSGWVGKGMAVVLIPDSKSKTGKRVVLTPPSANYQ